MHETLFKIVMADDDDDDQMLTKKAFQDAKIKNELISVYDGQELIDYLKDNSDEVGFILLDLNMPKMDGREALQYIKNDEKLKHIPTVILTTSSAEEDIIKSYDLGCNCYIRKPVDFKNMTEVIRTLGKFWIEIVKLPPS